MKKIFLSIALLMIAAIVFAQHPIGNDSFALQTLGSSATFVKSKGAAGSDSGFVVAIYTDTTAANKGHLHNYPGALMRTGDTVWLRNKTASSWILLTGTGGVSGINAIYAGNCLIKVNDSTLAFDPACSFDTSTLRGVYMDTAFAVNDTTTRYCKGGNCWNITIHSPYRFDTSTLRGVYMDTSYAVSDSTTRYCKGTTCWNITIHSHALFIESDPIALAKTISLHAGTNVAITGTTTQALNSNPSWIIAADDSDAFHTTHQISDTCFYIRRPNGTQDTVCITGGVSSALTWTNLFSAAFQAAGGVAGSTTNYGQITGRQTGWVAESGVQFVLSEDFTMSRLFVKTSTSQPAGGNLVITLRKNSSDQTLTVTIPAGSVAGTFSDLTHSVIIAAGDIIDWQVANGSGSTSATIISIGATGVGN